MRPSPMDLIATIVRTARGERLTDREFTRRLLDRMTPEQRERHYDDSCYYYESREGPYDHLIERAVDFGFITYDSGADRYQIGRAGKHFGVTSARNRRK